MQSTAFVFVLKSGNGGLLGESGISLPVGTVLIPHFTVFRALMIILTWTTGCALVMWLSEVVDQRGIGNGMSILIFTAVVSRLPYEGSLVLKQSTFEFVAILALAIGLVYAIVLVESGQRRIPVQFAKRVVGRRMYGGQSTYIPLKVNQSGVIPVIFATSLLSFPALAATILPKGVGKWINDHLVGQATTSWFYIASFGVLIMVFSYFYTAIAFNPQQQADIIRKQGGFIPGIRPGSAHRALPRQGSQPDHPARCVVPDGHLHHPVPRAQGVEHPRSVRWSHHPHRRRRHARDDEAARQPADDAQLRGLPLVAVTLSGRVGRDAVLRGAADVDDVAAHHEEGARTRDPPLRHAQSGSKRRHGLSAVCLERATRVCHGGTVIESSACCYDVAMPSARTRSQETGDRNDIDDATDAVLVASRALMGVVVRSLAIVEDDVTPVQYRALVVLASRGKQGGSELADALGVQASTATRLCDRLVAKGFIHRATSRQSGREITVTVTPAGRALVRAVTARRRREVSRIVERLPTDDRIRLRAALSSFAGAAGEMALPDDAWKLGWTP